MERRPNEGDATGDIYGFAFGEAAHARQTASNLAVCSRLLTALSCPWGRRGRKAFCVHSLTKQNNQKNNNNE